jgi:hypothetical protein
MYVQAKSWTWFVGRLPLGRGQSNRAVNPGSLPRVVVTGSRRCMRLSSLQAVVVVAEGRRRCWGLQGDVVAGSRHCTETSLRETSLRETSLYGIVGVVAGSRRCTRSFFVSRFFTLTEKGAFYPATMVLERRSRVLPSRKDLKSKKVDFGVCRHRGDDYTQK